MSMNSIIFNGATIYFDEPIDFHLIQGKLMIDSVPYKAEKVSGKKTKKIKTKSTSGFRDGSVGSMLVDAGLDINKPVTMHFGDYSTKTIHSAVKRMGFKHASVLKTNKAGVYTVSCTN